MHLRSRLLMPVLVLCLLGLAGAINARAAAEGHFDRSLKVTGPVDLDVSTGSGSITVRPGSSGTVEIHGKIRASGGLFSGDKDSQEKIRSIESNPPIEQDGNSIRIGHISDRELTHNISISYEITVPAATSLHSETGSGEQSVSGIQGPATVGSGSGSLKVSQIGNEVRASTGSGDISLDSVRGGIHASTGSGSIRATGIAGGMHVTTGSGSIHLEQTASGDVEVSTGSGSVELTGVQGALRVRTGSGEISAQGTPTGDWSLHSSSGTVLVRLPEQIGFDLDARTSSGTIHTSRPLTVQGTISHHELHGKAGGGGVRLDLSTSSGDIRVE